MIIGVIVGIVIASIGIFIALQQTSVEIASNVIPIEPMGTEILETPPIIITRGQFEDTELISTDERYNYTTNYPMPLIPSDCSAELLIYVHGFNNTPEEAIENFQIVKRTLEQLGYSEDIVGFSWTSNFVPLNYQKAERVAVQNGPMLASFIEDFKVECPNSIIRIVGHSQGSIVIFNAIHHLHTDPVFSDWDDHPMWKVDSIHLLGAAASNETPTDKDPKFKTAIENEVKKFYNKWNSEDDILRLYVSQPGPPALGKTGANGKTPDNYYDEDVTALLISDKDGDGDSDLFTGPGDNHSGYNGITRGNVLIHHGVMDRVVFDFYNGTKRDPHYYPNEPFCVYRVELDSIEHSEDYHW